MPQFLPMHQLLITKYKKQKKFFRPSGNAHTRLIIASETKQKNHLYHYLHIPKIHTRL